VVCRVGHFWTESLHRLIREVLRWMRGDLRARVENDLVLVLVLARVLVLVLVFVFVLGYISCAFSS
jgi:hypothetical protein